LTATDFYWFIIDTDAWTATINLPADDTAFDGNSYRFALWYHLTTQEGDELADPSAEISVNFDVQDPCVFTSLIYADISLRNGKMTIEPFEGTFAFEESIYFAGDMGGEVQYYMPLMID